MLNVSKFSVRSGPLAKTVLEILVVAVSVPCAFWLRLNLSLPATVSALVWNGVLLALISKLFAFRLVQIDRTWWRRFGIRDLESLLKANVIGSALFTTATAMLVGPAFPRSVLLIDFLLCFLLGGGIRFCVRYYYEVLAVNRQRPEHETPVLIYGAGAAGQAVLREIRQNISLPYRVLGFIDDDPRKKGTHLEGLRVLGSGADMQGLFSRTRDESTGIEVCRLRRGQHIVAAILVAMPTASPAQFKTVLGLCSSLKLKCWTVPGIGEIIAGRSLLGQIRAISLEDLLGRAPVQLVQSRVPEAFGGQAVLVTGAAGSIGSELCRQLARVNPALLVAFERSENDLFHLERELRASFPDLRLVAEIGDIFERRHFVAVLRRYQIRAIFHAAAYKHVPLMETNPLAAIRNNILSTYRVATAAQECGVEEFVMISSDKAVRPTNVMGATKRAAEVIISGLESSSTRFVSVRFGNVLGSNGSVVPVFREQIAAGGPVTVTHPEVERYFMTIREAVQLVLEASTMGRGGEIFVLDMGEPIRIVELARKLIELSGLIPDVDVKIAYTGLRPGEKLREELMTTGETILSTHHEKINIFFQQERPTRAAMEEWVRRFEQYTETRQTAAAVAALCELVPEYTPSPEVLGEAALGASV